MENLLLEQFEAVRKELHAYLCRLVIRPQVAEDLVQTAFLRCFQASARLPDSEQGMRAWIFKVASNLAFDELRKHATWKETMLLDLREAVERDQVIVDKSLGMIGTAETANIAQEHLVACLACTLRNLPEHKAAALLLKEMHGFNQLETAQILDVTPVQIKNWLQDARQFMDKQYGATCALLNKTGICYQCVELDEFFQAGQGNPLQENTDIGARLRIAASLKNQPWTSWYRLIFELISDLE